MYCIHRLVELILLRWPLLKPVCGVTAVLSKYKWDFLTELKQITLKFVWVHKRPLIGQSRERTELDVSHFLRLYSASLSKFWHFLLFWDFLLQCLLGCYNLSLSYSLSWIDVKLSLAFLSFCFSVPFCW